MSENKEIVKKELENLFEGSILALTGLSFEARKSEFTLQVQMRPLGDNPQGLLSTLETFDYLTAYDTEKVIDDLAERLAQQVPVKEKIEEVKKKKSNE